VHRARRAAANDVFWKPTLHSEHSLQLNQLKIYVSALASLFASQCFHVDFTLSLYTARNLLQASRQDAARAPH
jgi:hypothetical protein